MFVLSMPLQFDLKTYLFETIIIRIVKGVINGSWNKFRSVVKCKGKENGTLQKRLYSHSN